MKYKEIFTSWWFWVLVVVWAIIKGMWLPIAECFIGFLDTMWLPIAECLGFIIGSTLVIGILVSILWGLVWIVKKIYAKIKNK